MLKLDKQISGTIYRHILAANKAQHLKGAGCDVGGGGVQYTCLVGCRLPPLGGYVGMCLVLTIEVYDSIKLKCNLTVGFEPPVFGWSVIT